MKKLTTALLMTGTLLLAACSTTQAPTNNGNSAAPSTSNSSSSANTATIKLGFIGPLTGDAANIGQDARAATMIAVEDINAAGGVSGKQIEMIYEDGKCTGKDASNAANKLINIDKVAAIIGGACSSETSAVAGSAEASKIPELSYCSSAPNITTAGDYIFRNYPSDTFQGKFAAEYAAKELGKKKAAILYVKTDYGVGIKDVFSKEFAALGGEIVAAEGYEQTSRDLRTSLTKIKAANPDIVYFLGYTEATVAGLRQAAELQLNVPVLGGDAWDDQKIWEEAGTAGEGAIYSIIYAKGSDPFKQKMQAKGANITTCAPFAYDAVKLMAETIRQAGTDGEKIKNQLYKTNYQGGVSADKITFDSNGDIVGANYVLKKVSNGKAEEIR